ncbi:MAG: metallophosphoesterase [Polaromonas sp.]|nr:metallophosphoesterase [Polaromonas sp.]
MEQIFFCGDNHGRFDQLIEAVYEHAPAALVLLGDIQAQRPLEEELADIPDSTELRFIHGNRDTDSEADYDNLFGSELAHRNLHGRVVTIAGIRLGGLGGIFRGQVWKPPEPPKSESAKECTRTVGRSGRWRDGLPLRHRSTIFPDVYAALAKQRADVLVPHEAPSAHHHGFQALDELARSLQVRASFHGHDHVNMDYRRHWEQLGHQAFSVGFCGITALDGTVIRPGD